MAKLSAKIDFSNKCVRFSGPGTFSSKDLIKSLGAAKWNALDKSWVVSASNISKETLISMFEDIEVSEVGVALIEDELIDAGEYLDTVVNPHEIEEISTIPHISVSQLLTRISTTISMSFPQTIYVRGVLASAKQYFERVYLELSDSEDNNNRVNCVIWSDAERICKELSKAGFKLESDLPVLFEVQVGLSKKDARISLSVMSIVAEYTLAKLAAERDITNERLVKEGLFGKNKQTSLPFLSRRFGVLTSKGGTVINDFRASLDVAEFGFELVWLSVSVQGSSAAYEIVQGIKQLSQDKTLDAILLFRGGGSAAELSVFNNYEVAKAICECPIPIVSAIGHEKDESSAQDVSFLHFGVPKDIGRFFADKIIKFRDEFSKMGREIFVMSENLYNLASQRIESTVMHISQSMCNVLNVRQEVFERIVAGLSSMMSLFVNQRAQRLIDIARPISAMAVNVQSNAISRMRFEFRRLYQCVIAGIDSSCVSLNNIEIVMSQSAMRLCERAEDKVLHFEQIVNSASPEHQLKRGFALVKQCGSANYITSGASLHPLDMIDIEFFDATRTVKVEK